MSHFSQEHLKHDVTFTESKQPSRRLMAQLSPHLHRQDPLTQADLDAADCLLKLNPVGSSSPSKVAYAQIRRHYSVTCLFWEYSGQGFGDDYDPLRLPDISPVNNDKVHHVHEECCNTASCGSPFSSETSREYLTKSEQLELDSLPGEPDESVVTANDHLHQKRLNEKRRLIVLRKPLVRKDLEENITEKDTEWVLNEQFLSEEQGTDMYTPKFVVYDDNSVRLGVCPYCLNTYCLKNSSYRQHLMKHHGVDCRSKRAFHGFVTSREDEGLAFCLCECGDWISLQPCKVNGVYLVNLSTYYRHCQENPAKHVRE